MTVTPWAPKQGLRSPWTLYEPGWARLPLCPSSCVCLPRSLHVSEPVVSPTSYNSNVPDFREDLLRVPGAGLEHHGRFVKVCRVRPGL